MNIEKKDAKYVKALEFVFINAKRNRVNNVMDQEFANTKKTSNIATTRNAKVDQLFVAYQAVIKNQAKSTGATV